ncbi:hypothetical protein [Sorangium sp. So ce1000]|uniref:hypothetical protein n=1 Tax=Sorangium sp. So ce1000 TaxID=3133325 RepID=UPI003F5E9FAA
MAPLPDGEDGEGGAPSAEADGVDSDAGDGSPESWVPPTEETGPCEIAACSAHCARSMDLCELTPQYPSVEACCTVCEAMPSPEGYAGCRAAESGDPAGCTAAGPLGPEGDAACVGRCEAFCAVYAAVCPLGLADIADCEALCALLPAPAVFDACGPLTGDRSLGCSTQQLYAALGGADKADKKERDKVCRDILEGRCRPDPACADGD